MQLKCTRCSTDFYTASSTKVGTVCSVPSCKGTLIVSDPRKLAVARPA